MTTYPEIRVVKQQGCRISYWSLLLLGAMACFSFFIRTLELYGLVPLLFEGPFHGSFSFVCDRPWSLSYERRTGASPTCAQSFFAHHQLSSAEQSNSINQHLGLVSPTKLFSSVFEAQSSTGSPNRGIRLSQIIYIGCVFIGSSESEPTSVHQLRADTRHMSSHAQEGFIKLT